VDQGRLPAALLEEPATLEHWLGWSPFDLEEELARRGLADQGWLDEEAALVAPHENWLTPMLPARRAPAGTPADIEVLVPRPHADRFEALMMHGDPERLSDTDQVLFVYACDGLAPDVARHRLGIVLLAATKLSLGGARVQVSGPGIQPFELQDGTSERAPELSLLLRGCLRGAPWDRAGQLDLAVEYGYLAPDWMLDAAFP
jgi:hypothetical protein